MPFIAIITDRYGGPYTSIKIGTCEAHYLGIIRGRYGGLRLGIIIGMYGAPFLTLINAGMEAPNYPL
jgi:hypothetical protein